jgi:putative membrane protein
VFINYITLMLINMVTGLALLASFVYHGFDSNPKRWIPGFGMVGAIALATGLPMIWTWPVVGSFNIAFGETTVLFGILFVTTAIALAMNWDLYPITVYGFFAGITAILIGIRIINLDLTRRPLMSGLGFILTGLGGVLAAPTLVFLKDNRPWRILGTVVLIVAAVIWAITGYLAYWGHIADYGNWQPMP